MALQHIDDPAQAQDLCAAARAAGRSIGLVPTMGALHVGHLGLVKRARAENDLVVVSVFVNPLQFDKAVDLEKYPRDLAGDAAKLAGVGCDLLVTGVLVGPGGFFPEHARAEDIPSRAPGPAAAGMEGAHRLGHFDGVATIIRRLFELSQADRAYFGTKDFQQVLVAEHVARELDAERGRTQLTIVPVETFREPSGLARSSRNLRLSAAGRRAAAALSMGLFRARRAWREDGERDPERLEAHLAAGFDEARARLGPGLPELEVEYAAVRDPSAWSAERPQGPLTEGVALTAGWVEGVRPIDNLRLSGPELRPAPGTPPATPPRLELRPGEAAALLLAAPAKVNPWLEVHGRRADGLHEVELGMLAIDLEDHLRLAWREEPGALELSVVGPAASADIPTDATNLVHRAAARGLAELDGLPPGHLVIELTKYVPSQAGLGGGSSDAAAALFGVLELGRRLGARPRALVDDQRAAASLALLGSDCPFFLAARSTGFGLCRGRGEAVEPLDLGAEPALTGRELLVVTPDLTCSTGAVYGGLAASGGLEGPRHPVGPGAAPFNRLEAAALAVRPELGELAGLLAAGLPPSVGGASPWLLSGSGSSLFQWLEPGLSAFELDERARLAAALCGREPRYVGVHRAVGRGVAVLEARP